jgi:hypothetical protein
MDVDVHLLCPHRQPVGPQPHLFHCPRYPRCPCEFDLTLHAIGHTDDQTRCVAEWWADNWSGHTYTERQPLPEFEEDP